MSEKSLIQRFLGLDDTEHPDIDNATRRLALPVLAFAVTGVFALAIYSLADLAAHIVS